MVISKISLLTRIVERGFLPTDDADMRLRKVVLTLVPLIIGTAAFVWGVTYFLLGHFLSGAIPISYSIISAINLAHLFKTKRTTFIQNSQLTLVLILPFLLMWSLGGFSAGSMVMIWAVFTPVAALMFLEKRTALIWFIMYLSLIVISVLIDGYVSSVVTPLPDMARSIFYLLNLGSGSAGLYLLVSVAFSEEKRATEADLRIAASAFETQEGIMITDADNVIIRVNRAFVEMTGYTAEEAVGQTPRLLKSGRQDAAFYAAMRDRLRLTGSWAGEIWNRKKDGEIFPEQLTISAVKGEDGEVSHYVSMMHDISMRKSAEEQIRNLAFYDALTQVPNRRLLSDRLGQAMVAGKRSGCYGALMFMDLDNFKPLNDGYGHSVGDQLLVEVARRLGSCVRETDTVGRFGGDEFVVILSELSVSRVDSVAQAGTVAEKIRSKLEEPYLLTITHEDRAGSVEYRCTSSIGVVVFLDHEGSPDDMIKWADMAMYQAKDAGRNQIRFFDAKA